MVDEAIANFFIRTCTPFQRIDHESFDEMVDALLKARKDYKRPGRTKVTETLMPRIKNRMEEDVSLFFCRDVGETHPPKRWTRLWRI